MPIFVEPILLLGLFLCADGDAPKPAKAKFTISKETTYVTGPLDKDGYIDYAAALNERLGKGVTPENNANVLLWQAIGLQPEGKPVPAEFFKLMGMPPPPEKGEYFVPWWNYMRDTLRIGYYAPEREKLDEQQRNATRRPWKEADCPQLAAWLKANEKSLALVVEASKRTQFYSPVVIGLTKEGKSQGMLGASLNPSSQRQREIADALCMRAMLRTGEGSIEAAWEDLLACHRLSRLVGRRGTFIDGLIGVAKNQMACQADLAFLDRANLSPKQIDRCLTELHNLPAAHSVADAFDFNERFVPLDMLVRMDRDGLKTILDALGFAAGFADILGKAKDATEINSKKMKRLRKLSLDGVEMDTALKKVNERHDRVATILRKNEPTNRAKDFAAIDTDEGKLRDQLVGPGPVDRRVTGDGKARGELLGDLVNVLFPSVRAAQKMQEAAGRGEQTHANTILAFALARYQRDHGRYPDKLDALAPKYLAKVPLDLFSGKPLIYRPADKGYLLYSVGVNGKDDGGRGYGDEPIGGDDIVVRMPLPELARK